MSNTGNKKGEYFDPHAGDADPTPIQVSRNSTPSQSSQASATAQKRQISLPTQEQSPDTPVGTSSRGSGPDNPH